MMWSFQISWVWFYPILYTRHLFGAEEEDIFESDFESTDEEAAQAEVVTGEKEVQDEERQVRKVRTGHSFRRFMAKGYHSKRNLNWRRSLPRRTRVYGLHSIPLLQSATEHIRNRSQNDVSPWV